MPALSQDAIPAMPSIQLASLANIRFDQLPGDGRPLVFIHGLGCASTQDYASVCSSPTLRGRPALLIDLLGFGQSDRPEDADYSITAHAQRMRELLGVLAIDELDLFAHSMGGAVAIELAAMLGSRVHHLVLSEPNLDPGGGLFSRAIAGMSEAAYVRVGHARMIAQARATGSAAWADTMALASPQAVHRSAVSLVAGSIPSWRTTLLGLRCARTLIFGEQSLPDDDFNALPLQGVQVDVVPNAGHAMATENPEGLAECIARATPLAA
jgi:pimeloyl-ACP methyl ester carboxylesterase